MMLSLQYLLIGQVWRIASELIPLPPYCTVLFCVKFDTMKVCCRCITVQFKFSKRGIVYFKLSNKDPLEFQSPKHGNIKECTPDQLSTSSMNGCSLHHLTLGLKSEKKAPLESSKYVGCFGERMQHVRLHTRHVIRCLTQGHLDTQLGGASNLLVTSQPALPPTLLPPGFCSDIILHTSIMKGRLVLCVFGSSSLAP